MPQSPYAKLRASVNGGAASSGGLTVPASASVQLSADPAGTSGAFAYKYEIYGYPVGFSQPTSWSTDANGVYFYNSGSNPPVITLPSVSGWGKWMLRLTINFGVSSNTAAIPNAQLIDEQTALDMLSPHGMHDIGTNEGTQWSPHGWTFHHQANLRTLEAAF